MEDSCLISVISSGRFAAKNRIVARFTKIPIIPATPRCCCKFRVC